VGSICPQQKLNFATYLQICVFDVSLSSNSKANKMIIEFSVENYLSFKDLTTLSMIAAKSFKELGDTHIIEVDKKLNLLKSAVIYGNNASGKSNLLEAMGFMKATVLNSFRDALIENSERKFPLEKFKLNSKTEKESSFFEISFIHKSVKYRYGFEIDYEKVVAEWLYLTTSKEVYLFKRNFQNIEVNKTAFKEGLGKELDVKDNVLFLSLLATLGKETSSSIVDWFKKLNFMLD
jgi:AAA15 family ATPase/GTPase